LNQSLLGETPPNEPVIDLNKNYLEDLVGEGKKFKTAADLARGKYEADTFIETLKRQQDELRADYLRLRDEAEARAKLEDLITKFENGQKNTDPNNPPEQRVNTPVYKPEEVESLVSKKILENEASKKEQENFQSVQNRMKEVLGDDYQRIVRNRINELGVTEEYVNEQARKYPKALIKLLGVEDNDSQRGQQFQTPPQSARRSDSFAPKGADKRSWSYYQRMKQEDPKRYYDPKTNIQMHNDAIALGDAFKDGDFSRFGD
jgi:hypothetical protein